MRQASGLASLPFPGQPACLRVPREPTLRRAAVRPSQSHEGYAPRAELALIYRFAGFELDEEAGELRRAGRSIALQPKPFKLLRFLIAERARIVPTRELLRTLWPDAVVTPSSLTRAMSHARRAIGDDHRGSVLRSYARRGYRFCADVETLERPSTAGAAAGGRALEVAAPSDARPASASAPSPFVGREEARATLGEALARARAGRGSLVIVRGPAGIGKTRLCEVFIEEARAAGWRSWIGRCRDGEGVPAYWLWVQILRQLLEDESTREEACALAGRSEEIGGLIPDLANPACARAPASREQSRFLFYDGVTRVLARCAQRAGGMLLVLEDLQWAGSGALALLEHIAFETSGEPLLLVATVRDEPRERGHPLNRTLSVLKQQDRCEEIALRGLSRGEVAALLEQVLGRPAPVDFTSELFARTEGVPLFLREAIRLVSERGALEQVRRISGEGIRLPRRALDLIRRSLDALSEACLELLGAAAVLGREFALPALAEVAQTTRESSLEMLEEALGSGIVAPVAGAPATYRFSHALYQEAAYRALAASARPRLHLRAAERLLRLHAGDLDRAASELAHHHHRALAVADPERALEFATRAAALASRVYAYDHAAEHCQQVLDALDHCEPANPLRRLEAQIALGEAWLLAGERTSRRKLLREAMQSARALERPFDFARAAIAYCDLSEWGAYDRSAESALQEALAALPSVHGLARTRVQTRLAFLTARSSRQQAEPAARSAVEGARALGDSEALLEALYALHFTLSGPDDHAERAELTREMTELAPRCTRSDPALIALVDIASDRLTLGDPEGARRFRAEADRIAGANPHPGLAWHLRVYDAGLALLEGRFEEAELGARDAHRLGERIQHPYARGCLAAHVSALAFERGDPARVLEELSGFAEIPGGPQHWVLALLARARLELGRVAEARQLFESLAAHDFRDIPRNTRWATTLVELAGLCAELEDRERAKPLLELLGAVRDTHGLLAVAICYAGPVVRALARLEALCGQTRAADRLFAEALQAARALGARPMQARVLLEHGFLLASERDSARARASLSEAGALATALGMSAVRDRAQAQLAALERGGQRSRS